MKAMLLSVSLFLMAGAAGAEDTRHTDVLTPDALIWKDNPAFPKGIQIAVLVGDPSKSGETVVSRIKFPPNFQMPPHTHPYSEVVTVISGRIGTNSGEKVEKKGGLRSEEHTSELQSLAYLVCRLLLEKKKKKDI